MNNNALTISGATISYNSTSGSGSDGGGVYVNGSSATFSMTSGEISNNTCDDDGGGIYITAISSASMSGGKISSNTAKYCSSSIGIAYIFSITFPLKYTSNSFFISNFCRAKKTKRVYFN